MLWIINAVISKGVVFIKQLNNQLLCKSCFTTSRNPSNKHKTFVRFHNLLCFCECFDISNEKSLWKPSLFYIVLAVWIDCTAFGQSVRSVKWQRGYRRITFFCNFGESFSHWDRVSFPTIITFFAPTFLLSVKHSTSFSSWGGGTL